jgi:hypothetical protein
LKWTTFLRSCTRIRATNNCRNVADGTTNMSMAAMPIAWLRRKVRQVGDGLLNELGGSP